MGVVRPKAGHGDDLGQGRPAVFDGPHDAVAEAGIGPRRDLAHDAVPDEGTSGQGRVLAEQREQQGRRGQDDTGEPDQGRGDAPAHQDGHDRPPPGYPQRGHDRQADHQAEQCRLRGRQQHQHRHHHRRAGPDPSPRRIVQRRRHGCDKADGHDGAQTVLLVENAAPRPREQVGHPALSGKDQGHDDRGYGQDDKGQGEDLRQAPPTEARRHGVGAGAGHEHGDEAAQGRRRVDRPDHRHQAHENQGQQQRRAPRGAEQPAPGRHGQSDTAGIDRIIDEPDDAPVRRRLGGAVAEDRALPALGKAEKDEKAQNERPPKPLPVADKGSHGGFAGPLALPSGGVCRYGGLYGRLGRHESGTSFKGEPFGGCHTVLRAEALNDGLWLQNA